MTTNQLMPILNKGLKNLSKTAETTILKYNDGPIKRIRIKKFKNNSVNIHINLR